MAARIQIRSMARWLKWLALAYLVLQVIMFLQFYGPGSTPELRSFMQGLENAVRRLEPGEETRVALPLMPDDEWIGWEPAPYGTGLVVDLPPDLAMDVRRLIHRAPDGLYAFIVRGEAIVGRTRVPDCDLDLMRSPFVRSHHRYAVLRCEPRQRGCAPEWNDLCQGVLVGVE